MKFSSRDLFDPHHTKVIVLHYLISDFCHIHASEIFTRVCPCYLGDFDAQCLSFILSISVEGRRMKMNALFLPWKFYLGT